ncbi:MAG: Gfo/Idh/MocA family oxidoreductase [Lentisphaeria bacterium]|nr:Gfo/Idh/MocA family oxidoreductase [Lentisphaeria bacterium]
MINVAVIGVSGFGAVHYNDFVREHAAGRVNVVAATVINQAEEAEKCAFLKSIGCKLFTDYRAMLDEFRGKIDICFIPTGIAMHCPMTVAALESGANVYVEKPVAPTVEETEIMKAAETRTGKFVAVGYQTMYQPETRRIKELLLSGAIGTPRVFKSYALWPRNDAYYSRNNWAGMLAVNGKWVLDCPFTNALAHFLNLLIFYAGTTFEGTVDPVEVQAGMFRANRIETNDFATLRIKSSLDQQIYFHVTHVSETTVNPISRIEGDAGTIDYNEQRTVVTHKNGEVETFNSTPGYEMRKHIYDALLKRMNDPKQFICTLDLASKHTLISNAVFDSAPSVDIPAEVVRTVTGDDGVARRVVPGIDDVIRRAFKENRLVDTRDFPWAAPGQPFSLDNYRGFAGKWAETGK